LNFVILSAVRREPNEVEGPRVPLRYRIKVNDNVSRQVVEPETTFAVE